MRRRPSLILGALAALAPAPAGALPAHPVAPEPLHIEQGQRTAGPLDLAATTLAELNGQLVVTIVTRGDWTPRQLPARRRRRLCLTVGQAHTATTACIAPAAGGLGLRVAGRVAPVAGERPDAHTVVLRVDPTRLGLAPGRFTWQVVSAWTDAAGCPPTAACHGRLPAEGPAAYRLLASPPVGCTRSGIALNFNGPRTSRVVALTFDDGPWPDTPSFVSVLERERVPGTFFMIGGQVAGHAALLARELRDGDALGNHTFTHPFLTRTGDAQDQLQRTSAVIEQTSGYRPCVFRPPYGDQNAAVVGTALAQGMSTVVWDVDPSDYTRPGAGVIAARVLAGVRTGSIVLMHDGGGPRDQTLAALPRIIDALRARGYRFVTVPELLGYATLYA